MYPAIALSRVLLKEGHLVYLFVTKKRPGTITLEGFDFFESNSLGWDRTFLGGLRFIRGLSRDFVSTLRRLKEIHPDIVVGMGGYASIDPIIGAALLGIPKVIHEQNVIPGLANRFLAPLVDRIFVSFPTSREYLPKKKVVYTGLPLREEFYAIKNKHSKTTDMPTVIVLGGSQGARRINEVVLELLENKLIDDINLIHITGPTEFNRLKERIANVTYPFYTVYGYREDIWNLYREGDMAISRAGASSITELATMKLPAILIPYEGAGGHQLYNAKWLEHTGSAVVLRQNELSASTLARFILEIIGSEKLSQMKQAASRLDVPNASYVLAEEVLKLLPGGI